MRRRGGGVKGVERETGNGKRETGNVMRDA
jgi:hypothetical protein